MSNTNSSNLPTGINRRRGRPPTYTSPQERREATNARRRELRTNRETNNTSMSEIVEDGQVVTTRRRGRPPMYASTQERHDATNARRRELRRIQQNNVAAIQQTANNVVQMPTQQHQPDLSETRVSQTGDPPKQIKHFHQGSSSSAPAQKIVFCNICMTSKPFNKIFAIEGCKHSYCSRCLGSYIKTKINANMTKIKCPDATCKDGKLEPLACKSMITKKVFDHWCDALCESTVGERFYCPFKDCSALLMDERGQEVMQESECPHCHRLFCAHCRVSWHTGLSCSKFQEISQLGKEKKQESMLLELAKKSRWQRCPVCKFYVEKVSGCMFIKCRCGASFCYGCASAMEVDHYCAKCKR